MNSTSSNSMSSLIAMRDWAALGRAMAEARLDFLEADRYADLESSARRQLLTRSKADGSKEDD